ncbi:MAG: hypothetical protein JXB25_06085 [Deltaproteobacteria bacterium]|nr:hypothetical protein [Deltaproteobacteria bacterium]
MKRSRICSGWMVVPGLVVLVAFGCGPARYDKEDLANQKVKEVRGVITKQSRGSFVLRDDQEKEITFRTGECTQYIPENYRSQMGDRVRVTFQEVCGRSDPAKKILAVLQLEAVEIPDYNQPLPNPIEGEVLRVRRGSSVHSRSLVLKRPDAEKPLIVYVHNRAEIRIRGDLEEAATFNLESLVGKKLRVTAKPVPIFRGNAYIYETFLVEVL